MKPALFKYAKPRSLEAALECLAAYGDEAKVLAGGQSLLPIMNFRLARPAVLMDLSAVPGLADISVENGSVRVGSMVRQRDAELSERLQRVCPLIPRALKHVGHVQIRNRGTIGGSIAHADPAAELPAVVAALGAEVVALSLRGERRFRGSDFFAGPMSNVLDPDEIVVRIDFPNCEGMRSEFLEVARRGGDFAIVGVAASASWDGAGKRLSRVGIAAMGVGGTPVRLGAVEQLLEGSPLDDGLIAQAADAAAATIDPPVDVHADSASRRQILRALVDRIIRRVAT